MNNEVNIEKVWETSKAFMRGHLISINKYIKNRSKKKIDILMQQIKEKELELQGKINN